MAGVFSVPRGASTITDELSFGQWWISLKAIWCWLPHNQNLAMQPKSRGYKANRIRRFSDVPSNGTTGNKHRLEHWKICVKNRKDLLIVEGDQALPHIAQMT